MGLKVSLGSGAVAIICALGLFALFPTAPCLGDANDTACVDSNGDQAEAGEDGDKSQATNYVVPILGGIIGVVSGLKPNKSLSITFLVFGILNLLLAGLFWTVLGVASSACEAADEATKGDASKNKEFRETCDSIDIAFALCCIWLLDSIAMIVGGSVAVCCGEGGDGDKPVAVTAQVVS